MTKGQYLMDLTGKWLCERSFNYIGWKAKDTEGEFDRTDIEVWNADNSRHMFVEVKFRQNDSQEFSTFYFSYNKWKWLTDNQPDTPVYYAWKDKFTMFTLYFVSKYPTKWCRGAKNQATLEEGWILNFVIPVCDVQLYEYSPEQHNIIAMYNTKKMELMSNGEWKKEIDVKRLYKKSK